MDSETNYDTIAKVGVPNGRIQIIADLSISGDREIDATGLVVAPGFIDTHFHSVDPFATKLAVADGVTTGMDFGHCADRSCSCHDAIARSSCDAM
jgi:dihydroorotase-like cyclic amidohydrolase